MLHPLEMIAFSLMIFNGNIQKNHEKSRKSVIFQLAMFAMFDSQRVFLIADWLIVVTSFLKKWSDWMCPYENISGSRKHQ